MIIGICLIIICSCEEEEKHPKVITLEAVPISASTFKAKGLIAERGNISIVDHGFEYRMSKNGSYFSNRNTYSLGEGIVADTFSAVIHFPNDYYYYSGYRCYVKAYITNEKGIMYGDTVSFYFKW